MTNAQKAARLRMAIDHLEDADRWMQQSLGSTNKTRVYFERIQSLIEDLTNEIDELEA